MISVLILVSGEIFEGLECLLAFHECIIHSVQWLVTDIKRVTEMNLNESESVKVVRCYVVWFILIWMIYAGWNSVSGSFGRSKKNVSNHVISVCFRIGMRPLSHVSQEESHMTWRYKR